MRRKHKTSLAILATPAVAILACCGAIGSAFDDDETPTRTTATPTIATPTTAAPTTATPTTVAPTPRRTTTSPKPKVTTTKPKPKVTTAKPSNVYYANCSEVRAAGAAPLYRGQPGYRSGLDRDGDGVACES